VNGPRGLQFKSENPAEIPRIVFGEGLADLASKIREAIAHRAYELFEARGYVRGHDLDDWLQAEAELVHPLSVDIWQSEQEVVVTAQVPGFRAEEVSIGVEPGRVFIWARPDPKPVDSNAYPTRASIALYHTLDLPVKVNPSKATVRLSHGLLKIELPKVVARSGVTKHLYNPASTWE
jgi:HSP20 family molecular chaperone IbpA